jgi:hypothetical protein
MQYTRSDEDRNNIKCVLKVGEKIGEWLVIREVSRDKNGHRKFLCKCSCGVEKSVQMGALINGETSRCISCARRASSTTHGLYSHPLYHVWYDMKTRCNTQTSSSYKNYGGRGIKICNRWLNSLENFIEDMGEKPSPKHSIDRIDNNGNYEPSNCRWATRLEQAHNRGTRSDNISGVTGVSWNKKYKSWVSNIMVRGERTHLGSFKHKKDAIKSRMDAERKLNFGEKQ